jgi:hypothetical protein
MMTEDELRDLLSDHLEVLEPGLRLLGKERYVPNVSGTRGFIDIHARDDSGHHVLIELKRSDSAAREAVHELYKYVEGVKSHLCARDEEIRLIVASTEWRELIVPFSRFVADTSLTISGFELHVDVEARAISAQKVAPLQISKGRYLAQWHELNFYVSASSLDRGIRAHETVSQKKGISDYVLVIMKAPPARQESDEEETRRTLARNRAQSRSGSAVNAAADTRRTPRYEFIAYFAMQMFSREACLAIVSSVDAEQAAALSKDLQNMEEEAALGYLHEAVLELNPQAHRDGIEIGYPAKFHSRLLETEGWTIVEVRRYGAFARNSLLTDTAILEEIGGAGGASGQRLKRTFSIGKRSHLSSLRADLRVCLRDNPVWLAHLLRHIDEIEKDFPTAEAEIQVLNPCAGVMTLFMGTSRADGVLYLPNYILVINDDELSRIYYGELIGEGSPCTFGRMLDKYYDGKLTLLLRTLTWGGYERRDTALLEDLGLVYRSFRDEVTSGGRQRFVLSGERWRPSDEAPPFAAFFEFAQKNADLIELLHVKIGSRWDGVFADGSSSERALDYIQDIARGRRRAQYFTPPPQRCDICDCSLQKRRYFIDGALRDRLQWAAMCPDCHGEFGQGIGRGKGQLYSNQPEGWLLVGGLEGD